MFNACLGNFKGMVKEFLRDCKGMVKGCEGFLVDVSRIFRGCLENV